MEEVLFQVWDIAQPGIAMVEYPESVKNANLLLKPLADMLAEIPESHSKWQKRANEDSDLFMLLWEGS